MFEFVKKWFRRKKKEEEVVPAEPAPVTEAEEIPETRYTPEYQEFVGKITSDAEEDGEEVTKAAPGETSEEIPETRYTPEYQEFVETITSETDDVKKTAELPEEEPAEEEEAEEADPFADLAAMEDDENNA